MNNNDRFALVSHLLLVLTAMAASVVLALFHLIPGSAALAVVAGAAGLASASGASLIGGNLALRTQPSMAAAGSYTQALRDVGAKLDRIVALLTAAPPAPSPTPTPPVPTNPPAPIPAPVPTVIRSVYWFNQSQGDLNAADAQAIVEALNVQHAQVMAAWPGLQPVTHVVGGDPAAVPVDAWRMYWLPDADAAGALGYHSVDPHGYPYSRCFSRYEGKAWPALQPGPDGISISNISSHEACELVVDPDCTATATAPNGDVWALESADPTENYAYNVTTAAGVAVSVSDFVTAAFFGDGTGPADYLGKAQPWTISPGGYAVVNSRQVFADQPSLRFLSQQGSPAGRTARRLRRA